MKNQSVRNVTISLPLQLVQKARLAAVREDLSLSSWLAKQLKALLDENESYRNARRQALENLQRLPAVGRVSLKSGWRDGIHER